MFLKSFQHDVGSSFAQLRVITSGIPSCSTYTGCFCCSYRTPLPSYLQTDPTTGGSIAKRVGRRWPVARYMHDDKDNDVCTLQRRSTTLSISVIINPRAIDLNVLSLRNRDVDFVAALRQIPLDHPCVLSRKLPLLSNRRTEQSTVREKFKFTRIESRVPLFLPLMGELFYRGSV